MKKGHGCWPRWSKWKSREVWCRAWLSCSSYNTALTFTSTRGRCSTLVARSMRHVWPWCWPTTAWGLNSMAPARFWGRAILATNAPEGEDKETWYDEYNEETFWPCYRKMFVSCWFVVNHSKRNHVLTKQYRLKTTKYSRGRKWIAEFCFCFLIWLWLSALCHHPTCSRRTSIGPAFGCH